MRDIFKLMSSIFLELKRVPAATPAAAATTPAATPAALQPTPNAGASPPLPPPPSPPNTPPPLPFCLPPGVPAPPLAIFDGKTPSDAFAWLATAETWLSVVFGVAFLATPLDGLTYLATFYLGSGAAQWWQSCLASSTSSPYAKSGGFSSFSSFRDAFTIALGIPNPQDKARRDLDTIKQTSTVSAYAAKFQSIAAHLPSSEVGNLRYAFLRGLKPEIQAHLDGKINTATGSWHEAHSIALAFESSPMYRPSTPSSSFRRPPPPPARRTSDSPARLAAIATPNRTRGRSPTPRPPTTSSPPTKLAPLTDEDRKYLIENGGCFRCRELGHRSFECTTFTNSRTPGPSRGASPLRSALKN
jgi:hypothetical protein